MLESGWVLARSRGLELLVPVVLALDHLDDDAGQGCLVGLEEWRLCGRCEIFR